VTKPSLRLLGLGGALLAIALSAGAASAQDKEKVVAERQELMKQQGREWVAIRNYLQGKGEQAAALSGAEALSKSVPKVAQYFPPGTGEGEVPVKTRGKTEIWKQHDKFLAAEKTVASQVAAVEAALKAGDKEKTEVAFKELDGCNACHREFRAPAQ
jgi:cytochrome c556